MKKLLYITTNLQGSGGVARILSVKLNYLIEKYSYHISVINTNQKNNNFFYDFNHQIKFYSIQTKQVFKYKKQLNVFINNIEPDIIVNCDNGLKGSLLPYLMNLKIPLIYERHCGKYIRVGTFKEKLFLRLANFIIEKSISKYKEFIVLNDFEKKDWKRKDIIVISNPIWFKVSSKTELSDDKIVVAVGRHAYEKRYDKLLNIWKQVVKDHPNWILKIYGEKNIKNNIEQLAAEQDLVKSVKLCKPINDLETIYSCAAMLLTTSESESFPLALIEAMAFGLPIIAFDNYGSRNIIENSINGFLIKQNDTKDYIEKTKLLIKNDGLRQTMGKNAQRIIQKFDLKSVMRTWHNLFQSIH